MVGSNGHGVPRTVEVTGSSQRLTVVLDPEERHPYPQAGLEGIAEKLAEKEITDGVLLSAGSLGEIVGELLKCREWLQKLLASNVDVVPSVLTYLGSVTGSRGAETAEPEGESGG